MKSFLVGIFLTIVLFVGFSSVYASPFGAWTQQERNQLFNSTPQFQSNSINYYFQIIITPDGTKLNNVILSSDNYTALKNNVAFFTACGGFNNNLCIPPTLTTQTPQNYCPIAKSILLGQDGYLNKLYNNSTDLTDLVYPSYCYTETGNNPINGKGIPSVPEFGDISFILTAVGMIIMISISMAIIGNKRRQK